MWLGALALDLAETKLQNMTPSLTLGDFQYTGENSTIIKDAIYSSALNVTFTGASVSVCICMYQNYITYCAIYPIDDMHNNNNNNPVIPDNIYELIMHAFLHATGIHQAPPQWG